MSSDVFTLYYLRDRVQAALPAEDRTAYDTQLGILQAAAVEGDLGAAARAAGRLRSALVP